MSMRENENRAVTRERFSREACVVSYGGDSRGAGVAACGNVSRGAAEPQRLGGFVGELAGETTAQETEGSKVLRVSASLRGKTAVTCGGDSREAGVAACGNVSRGAAEPQRRDLNAVTADIVDAAVGIHKRLGPGLLETVYEMVLAAELARRGHLVVRQQLVSFDYEGLHFENAFRIDLLVDDSVIVELKSAEKMAPVFYKQLKTYLVLAERSVGLVLNFGMATMVDGIKRVVYRYDDSGTHENVFLRGDADLREDVSRGAAEPQRLGGVVGGLAGETTAQGTEGSEALRVSASRRENKSVNASRGAAEPQRLGGVVGGLANETTAQEAEGSKALRVSASRRENKSVNASRGAAEPQRLGGVVGGLASETTA